MGGQARATGRTRVRPHLAAALVLAAVAGGGCSAADRPAPGPGGPQPARPSTTPAPAPPDDTTASRREPVRIALAGDVHFESALADRLRRVPRDALAPVARVLGAADVAVLNLETSVGTGGRPEPGKRFVFTAPPAAFEALAAVGVDVAVMANNHALDLGRARVRQALRAARVAGVDVAGIGRDARSARRAVVTSVRGTRVATVAASVADQDPTADPTGHWAAGPGRPGIAVALDPTGLLREVRRARAVADVVLVYLHWGVQGERCPSPDQRDLARRLVDAGADVVAGAHTHLLQGDGRLGEGYVAYGLGNFAWYSPGPSGVLTLRVRPAVTRGERARVTRTRWWPAAIGDDGVPREATGPEAAGSRAERRSLRRCAGLG
ncbi:CapA family protein [Nocardioides sp. J2M5]|uniref:CapA family protein n=1 Tax=Nocardioides palaemonis TaxID=2829810 RepID=UPI001BA8F98C|nr:CapA family protein [Nocardioides palaemonis]MBS2938183.1 CapA family protein [Nocardioides palaemonis]